MISDAAREAHYRQQARNHAHMMRLTDRPGETDQELQDLAQRVREWAASPEGHAAIEESLRRAEETIRELRAKQRIDPADLHRPMTI
jgi:hypothetical protein